jgi:tetratricopeptide (TPR) repeat protein
LDVRAYHLTNICLHILVALALYWLLLLLFSDPLLSLITSLLFVVHPIHTEAVTYISGRSDSLAALFILLCLIFYIKYWEKSGKTNYSLMAIACVCALLSREISIIIALLALLYHFVFRKRVNIKSIALMAGLTIIYALIRLTVLKSFLPEKADSVFLQRLPGFFVALTNYLRLIVFPVDLHMEYGQKAFSFFEPKALIGLIILVILLCWALRKRASDTKKSFAIIWFLVTILPSSNLYPVNAYMAEHWLYLPSMGIFLLFACAITALYRIRALRGLVISCLVLIIMFYSAMTLKQNEYWADALIFYQRNLRYGPKTSRLYNNLGNAYIERSRPQEALVYYRKVLAIDPKFAQAYYNIGNTYAGLNDYARAEKFYRKCTELDPDFANGYFNLGVIYSKTRAYKLAIVEYLKVIKINPGFAKAHNNLAAAFYDTQEFELAIKHCDEAVKLGYKVDLGFLKLLTPLRKK